MRTSPWLLFVVVSAVAFFCKSAALAGGGLPKEPIEIGVTPQFFVDDYIVDNRWAIKQKSQEVLRVFHPPHKHAANPVIAGQGGYVSVVHDSAAGLFRMWYQTHAATSPDDEKNLYGIAYAESPDGLRWTLPKLGLHQWKGSKDNNIVWRGLADSRASGQHILSLPEADRRGYRYIMAYHGSGRGANGIRLVGSHDGIHWDKASDRLLAEFSSVTLNSIVFDPTRGEYVMYCRAKNSYRLFQGDILDTGESRRVARMASPELWTEWTSSPQNMLIPDELDMARGFNRFYGMPATWHAGVYWGFLWPFRLNTDIWTELVVSRDGIHFERLPGRPEVIAQGPDGAWDDGMVFGGPGWLEIGDQWWLYYAGFDGPHESRERTAGIGLAQLRKEGFVSLRGPAGGGVIVTRQIRWPGGKLWVNADAHLGELKVRVSGERRKPIEGFDYDDCQPFAGDKVAHAIAWQQRSLDELKGQVIRLEFYLKDADLYTFRAE